MVKSATQVVSGMRHLSVNGSVEPVSARVILSLSFSSPNHPASESPGGGLPSRMIESEVAEAGGDNHQCQSMLTVLFSSDALSCTSVFDAWTGNTYDNDSSCSPLISFNRTSTIVDANKLNG